MVENICIHSLPRSKQDQCEMSTFLKIDLGLYNILYQNLQFRKQAQVTLFTKKFTIKREW